MNSKNGSGIWKWNTASDSKRRCTHNLTHPTCQLTIKLVALTVSLQVSHLTDQPRNGKIQLEDPVIRFAVSSHVMRANSRVFVLGSELTLKHRFTLTLWENIALWWIFCIDFFLPICRQQHFPLTQLTFPGVASKNNQLRSTKCWNPRTITTANSATICQLGWGQRRRENSCSLPRGLKKVSITHQLLA